MGGVYECVHAACTNDVVSKVGLERGAEYYQGEKGMRKRGPVESDFVCFVHLLSLGLRTMTTTYLALDEYLWNEWQKASFCFAGCHINEEGNPRAGLKRCSL